MGRSKVTSTGFGSILRSNYLSLVLKSIGIVQNTRSDEDASVEHVLPRIVPEESHWNRIWPSAAVQRELAETAGNFVIVPRHVNRIADRLEFREKKKLYFADGVRVFALTEDLRGRETWTPDDVRERTEQLVDILMGVWFPDPLG